ncbi:potassium channel family protein [Limosilactobacillus equigenerosi]|uniref:Potassium channel domain-containing protein n=2 Tax=Limosilactobacillus TaxID=2742598 RepID=A0A0R1UYY7_9LACO|nr:potassium channel family protein [Limosilactobacillus equigenerosi]KRL96328.1 hypothetical protein FC21_GL000329 [Limosilactobacillus equigenerosi DSM 18793 = JCM 14505]
MKKIVETVRTHRSVYIGYQVLMAFLAIVSIVMIVMDYSGELDIDTPPLIFVDYGIWGIFVVDYVIRFGAATSKRSFVIHHIADLLSIIPVSGLFDFFRMSRIGRALRIVHLLRLLRIVGLVGRLERFFQLRGMFYYLYLSMGTMLFTSGIFSISEHVSFMTGLWLSITTTMTVGYGDVAPVTVLGKVAAVIDMFLGIGFIGMLTSSITNVFSREETDVERLEKKIDLLTEEIKALKEQQSQDD